MNKPKETPDSIDASPPLTWVDYAIAATIIAIVVMGLIGLIGAVTSLQGQIFSNITRGLPRN